MATVANVLACAADRLRVGGRGGRAVRGARPARRARARRRGPRAPAHLRGAARRPAPGPARARPRRRAPAAGRRGRRATTSSASATGWPRAVEQIREVMLDLHPVHAPGRRPGVGAARDLHAAGRGSAATTCDVEIEPAAAGRRDELVLSLARELLRNAAKHARAREVAVRVTLERRRRAPRGHRRRRGHRARPAARGARAGPHRRRLEPRARGGDRRLVPRRRPRRRPPGTQARPPPLP